MKNIDIEVINEFAKNIDVNHYGTHMPYVFYDLNNTQLLIFDVLINNVWKLHIYNPLTKEIKRINTPTINDYTINECNPVCIIEDNQYILSYTHGPKSDRM